MRRGQPRSTRTDPLFPDTTLVRSHRRHAEDGRARNVGSGLAVGWPYGRALRPRGDGGLHLHAEAPPPGRRQDPCTLDRPVQPRHPAAAGRSEEHTSELQSLLRISYAVFCLKKKTTTITNNHL